MYTVYSIFALSSLQAPTPSQIHDLFFFIIVIYYYCFMCVYMHKYTNTTCWVHLVYVYVFRADFLVMDN